MNRQIIWEKIFFLYPAQIRTSNADFKDRFGERAFKNKSLSICNNFRNVKSFRFAKALL